MMIKLTIEDNHFMNNIFNILKWDAQRNLNLLRKPVDKGTLMIQQDLTQHDVQSYFILLHLDTWSGAQPAVVNAFYNPNKNDIGEA